MALWKYERCGGNRGFGRVGNKGVKVEMGMRRGGWGRRGSVGFGMGDVGGVLLWEIRLGSGSLRPS